MRDRYASLREGLVGAWIPSVSGSGLLLPDLSGQGNNGALTNMGPEDWVAGEYGRALDFDGSNDYVEIGYSKALDITGPITVSGWIKTTTTQSQVIYGGYQNVSPYPGLAVGLSIPGANAGRLVFWNGGSWTASTSTSYNSGEWTHVAVSYSGSSVSFYKNGFLDGVQAEGATTSWTGPRYLGVNLGAPNYLDGQLDDVRIYNRALSEPEIKLLSQEPGVGFKRTRSVFDFGRKSAYLPPTPTDYRTVRVKQTEHASLREGLVGAWIPSVSGSGLLLPDLSGQGNNGALTNMGPEDWVSGQYGRALDFDGSNDYVTLPVYSKLPFSVSLWFLGRTNDNVQQIFTLGNSTNLLQLFAITLRGDLIGDPIHAQMRALNAGVNTRAEVLGYLPNKWNHVTAVFGGIAYRQIWLNGVAGTADTTSYALQSFDLQTIGALRRLTDSGFLNGQIDDVRQYNRVLSESEIKLLASRPGIGLRPQRRTMYYAPPTGARRRRILTSMP